MSLPSDLFGPRSRTEVVVEEEPDNVLQRNAVEALQAQRDNFVLLLDTPDGIVAYAVTHDAEGMFEQRCVDFIEEGMA